MDGRRKLVGSPCKHSQLSDVVAQFIAWTNAPDEFCRFTLKEGC